MSFIYRWTRPPLLCLLITIFGLSLLIQVLVLFHGQDVLIIPYEYILIFTSIGAAFPLTGAVIIFADSLSKISGIPPSKIEKPVIISTGIVLLTFLALYYLPYEIAYLVKNLGPLDSLTHIPNPVKYVLSINLAIIFIVFITLRIQVKAQTAAQIRRKKARKKR